jgi:hypothetical protein
MLFCLIPLLADRTGDRLWSHLGLQNYEKAAIRRLFLGSFFTFLFVGPGTHLL